MSDYLIQTLRDTLENWQSAFLQLLWQVGGLAVLLHLGSPLSKEGSDRLEEKIDAILRWLDPQGGARTIPNLTDVSNGSLTIHQNTGFAGADPAARGLSGILCGGPY